jgi:cellulose synthase/poly-beta-1,6-N-acetylglucosamine synthase-like glycosyltransferase
MEVIFWLLAAVVVYVYAGYPLLLVALSALGARRPVRKAESEPSVTLIISAFNEAAVIAEKIRNSLALDYPREKIEIVVISDASDDGTDEIVGQFASQGVRLLRMNDRGGKTLGLNAGVRSAKGEIVVFSDANAMYLPDAIRKMARNFADPAVGAVVGESTYADAEGGAQQSESLYWKYETGIKRLETQIGSTVGGDGAIYAIRRALYRDMRADALSDFVNPMQIVMSGYRCIYEPEARSVEEAAEGFDKEFRRKVRIVNRAWRATWTLPALLNPVRFGWFSLELVSHKLLRWLMPLFLVAVLLLNVLLLERAPLYSWLLVLQLVFYALALAGYLTRGRPTQPRLIYVPYYFCLVNIASARGIIEAYRGRTYTTWATPRATSKPS